MSHHTTDSSGDGNERPRQWFIGNGLAAFGASVLIVIARFLEIDTLLIWWAGAAHATQIQDAIRFVFTDLLPIFVITGGFGGYLLVRGIGIDGRTGRITRLDSWIARACGLLLVGSVLIIVFL